MIGLLSKEMFSRQMVKRRIYSAFDHGDLSIKEIAKLARVSTCSVYKYIWELYDDGLVKTTNRKPLVFQRVP